ncbi:hypothetical protein RND71_008324 [Anisodus tanguticus]|uniref:Uncharacterized protein n=1 Tax=Anisodus tanguticus TaxID=243964 RepID=A0AAE1VU68_9SOLA|nr:hypothetical protein RND71_008324 [Anisodus tanguticus]
MTHPEIHPVTKFYEVCQKYGWSVELIDTWEETGEIEVFVDGKFAGKEKFSGKKLIALNRAAHNAYCEIVKNLNVETTSDDSAFKGITIKNNIAIKCKNEEAQYIGNYQGCQ